MRKLASGNSIVECQKAVARMKAGGWKPLTDIKLDDSLGTYGILRYVCVMELHENDNQKRGNRKWFQSW